MGENTASNIFIFIQYTTNQAQHGWFRSRRRRMPSSVPLRPHYRFFKGTLDAVAQPMHAWNRPIIHNPISHVLSSSSVHHLDTCKDFCLI